ncbi:hypothetical protein DAI22_05g084801 [Oryza sativa Japonica Group]|nr:hypothetical protein DAI22_05g084801 [Oryza sativa Japonica Group]
MVRILRYLFGITADRWIFITLLPPVRTSSSDFKLHLQVFRLRIFLKSQNSSQS